MQTSFPPPSLSAGPHRLRPWYLIAAMVFVCFTGLWGVRNAYETMEYLRGGALPDVRRAAELALDQGVPAIYAVLITARLRAMSELRHVTFPLTVAELILSGFLFVAGWLALTGRPGARQLALQALLANLLIVVADYVLTRAVRASWIETVTQFAATQPLPDDFKQRSVWWWAARFALVIDVALLALATFTLLKQRTKLYFQAVADASDTTEEP